MAMYVVGPKDGLRHEVHIYSGIVASVPVSDGNKLLDVSNETLPSEGIDVKNIAAGNLQSTQLKGTTVFFADATGVDRMAVLTMISPVETRIGCGPGQGSVLMNVAGATMVCRVVCPGTIAVGDTARIVLAPAA